MQAEEKDKNINGPDTLLDMIGGVQKSSEELALDRTRMAAERTLMAWVRTSLSMISFGFTVFKFIQIIEENNMSKFIQDHTARNFGLFLISIGTFALIIAILQHYKYLKVLGLGLHSKFWDLSFVVACLIGLLGLVMFVSIVLNAGPFS